MTKQTKQVEPQIRLFLIEAFSDYATELQTRKKFSNMSDVVEKHSNRLSEIVSQAQQEVVERVTPVIDRLISLRDEIPHSNATRDSERFAYQKAIDLLVALQQEQE